MAKKQKATAARAADVKIIKPQDIGLSPETETRLSPQGFSQCVRVLRQNWRQGTVACKGRSDVAFSNKKPWKQKGTGRARAGSARSPLWRKGGVIFGPQPRIRELEAPQALRKQVSKGILWEYLKQEKVMSLEFAPQATPKTALAYKALQNAGLDGKKITLFVAKFDTATHASFDNIANVHMLLFDQPNVYHLAHSEYWVILNKDVDAFKEMVHRWI